MVPLIVFHILPFWNTLTRIVVTAAWALLVIIDTVDIMIKMKKDERERIHEAVAERNALWGMLIVIVAGIFYDIVTNALQERIYVNPFLIGALVVGLIIKCVSNIYLDKKN